MRVGTFHLAGSPTMAPASERFAETLGQIRLADELGFDTVWVAEHHFSHYGYSANPLLLIARVTDLLGWFDIGGLPDQTVQRSMRLFAEEVVPALAPVRA